MGVKENIKLLRKKYDLKQSDLAEIAGVTDKAVSTWETGAAEPRMGAIEKIAAHFNLKKSDLIEEGGLEDVNLLQITVTSEEHSLLEKYRILDERGKNMIHAILDAESKLSNQ